MRYLKKFSTQEEYDNYLLSPEFVLPNVSLVGDKVYYHTANKLLPLFVEAIEPLTVSFSVNPIEYSLDNRTWQTLPVGASTPTIEAGKRVYFRASGLTATSADGIGTFSATGKHNIGGNIMSMAYGAGFKGKIEITQTYQFYKLFKGTPVINASMLMLPAMVLTTECYRCLFQDCTSLINAPKLPATTMANDCYRGLFYTCTSLVNAPELPATTMADGCYRAMFYDCTSLVNVSQLPALNLADYCYSSMFYNCTSLINAPELPATTMKPYCYSAMFQSCTSLVNAPMLPATDLTSANFCYNGMYAFCSKLRYLKAMILTPPPNNSGYGYQTGNWVNGVTSSGVFVKNSKATWNVRGEHGIPSGWTIELADE